MLVRLFTCNSSLEAHWAKTYLANNEINSYLFHENFTTLMPVYNGMLGAGIQLFVESKNYDSAFSLIFPTPKIVDGKMCCPNCKNSDVKFDLGKNKKSKWTLILISFFFGIAFNNINNVYYCRSCDLEF